MQAKETFLQVMAEQQEIALATSVGGQPNVRIVNFIYLPETKCVYFSTFKGNDKVGELRANDKVAFTTIVSDGDSSHVRVLEGVARESELSLQELAVPLIEKFPFYKEIIDHGADEMLVIEIHFDNAVLITGMESRVEIAN